MCMQGRPERFADSPDIAGFELTPVAGPNWSANISNALSFNALQTISIAGHDTLLTSFGRVPQDGPSDLCQIGC